MLGHVFPVERTFMVKPQAKIRPPYTRVRQPDRQSDDSDLPLDTETVTRVSIDSMGDITTSRMVDSARERVDEPDFIVVKSGPEYGSDRPLAIVEVKKDHRTMSQSIGQIQRYLANILDKGPPNDLKGYLVVKGVTYVFPMPSSKTTLADCTAEITTSGQLKEALARVASTHWT